MRTTEDLDRDPGSDVDDLLLGILSEKSTRQEVIIWLTTLIARGEISEGQCRILEKLSEQEWEIFWRHGVWKQKSSDCAIALGISEESVRGKLFKIRHDLKLPSVKLARAGARWLRADCRHDAAGRPIDAPLVGLRDHRRTAFVMAGLLALEVEWLNNRTARIPCAAPRNVRLMLRGERQLPAGGAPRYHLSFEERDSEATYSYTLNVRDEVVPASVWRSDAVTPPRGTPATSDVAVKWRGEWQGDACVEDVWGTVDRASFHVEPGRARQFRLILAVDTDHRVEVMARLDARPGVGSARWSAGGREDLDAVEVWDLGDRRLWLSVSYEGRVKLTGLLNVSVPDVVADQRAGEREPP
jgi:hypothetical protein